MSTLAHTNPGYAHLVGRWGRVVVISVPMVFLLLFFLLPFLVVFKISVSEMDTVFFKDVLTFKDDTIFLALKYGNYISLTQDALYLTAYLSSIKIAAIPNTGLGTKGANLMRLTFGAHYQVNSTTQWKAEYRSNQSSGYNFVNSNGSYSKDKQSMATSLVLSF